jgi:hypothetical protein
MLRAPIKPKATYEAFLEGLWMFRTDIMLEWKAPATPQ